MCRRDAPESACTDSLDHPVAPFVVCFDTIVMLENTGIIRVARR